MMAIRRIAVEEAFKTQAVYEANAQRVFKLKA